jgi:nitrogen fixation/metabolism regulation signal transduction histidine kinase
MAFRQRFLGGLLVRVAVLVLAAFAFVAMIRLPDHAAALLVSGLICLAAIFSLWRYVQRINRDLARFFESVRFADLSQRFDHQTLGSGFGEIGAALERSLDVLREERGKLIDANQFYEAVLDDAPIPLLTIDEDRRVELANKAARRLFTRHAGPGIEGFAEYGSAFTQCLTGVAAHGPRLVPLMIDSVPQMAMVSTAAVQRLGGLVHAVAVQPIQSELNAAEVAAQSDLVRVLTHEIMNSMTPVTSLAHSAAALLESAGENGAQLADARMAVERLARRADGVMHFVESYRQISRKPQVRRRRFVVLDWARELEALFRASEAGKAAELRLAVEPPDLTIDADPDLLSQVLINLLRNGAEAASGSAKAPAVSLRFSTTRSGATQIEVTDNGPGIPQDLARDIFLPFFTTKAEGTGVGLSVARQMVIAHGGSIVVEDGPEGGALFRILI